MTINDLLEVQGLVDTGAQKSLIHFSILAASDLQQQIEKSQQFRIKAIGERGDISAIGVINLSVVVGKSVFEPVNYLVVPESVVMENKMILGMDFLSRNKLTVNAPKRIITKRMNKGASVDFYLSDKGHYQKTMLRSILCCRGNYS